VLERYGWSDALQRQFEVHAAEGLVPARVLVQQRGHYEIVAGTGERTAALASKFAREAEEGGYPVAGDWVAIAAQDDGAAFIRAVVPRKGVFVRRAAGPGVARMQIVAANVDVALLVASLNGDLNVRRIERYLAAAWESGAEPVIVLTKADACEDVEALKSDVEAVAFGVPVHTVSAVTGEGLDALRAHLLPGRTAVLVGSSGAGKSTLVNAFAGEALMLTRAISADGQRGRHTTTHRELVLLPSGALILDTPGMRELGLWDADAGVAAAFADVESLMTQCRFSDCHHRAEPGCAVRAALDGGTLDAARWESYGKLQRELHFERNKTDWQSRQETRKVWMKRHKDHRAKKKFDGRDE
jgi:ribosome biogenesis GTPase